MVVQELNEGLTFPKTAETVYGVATTKTDDGLLALDAEKTASAEGEDQEGAPEEGRPHQGVPGQGEEGRGRRRLRTHRQGDVQRLLQQLSSILEGIPRVLESPRHLCRVLKRRRRERRWRQERLLGPKTSFAISPTGTSTFRSSWRCSGATRKTTASRRCWPIEQEKVGWPEKILVPIGEHLYVVQKGADRVVKCSCGYEFGDYRQNWKLNAVVYVRDTEESLDEIYPGPRKCDVTWMGLQGVLLPGLWHHPRDGGRAAGLSRGLRLPTGA